MKTIVQCFLLLSLFVQCDRYNAHDTGLLTPSDVTAIRKQFSEQAIRYFYQSAFFVDRNSDTLVSDTSARVWKWKEISIKLSGNVKAEDSVIAQKVIDTLNALQLPLTITIAPPHSSFYNIEVFFVPRSKYDSIHKWGVGLPSAKRAKAGGGLSSNSSSMNFALIGIPIGESLRTKEGLLLHELVNGLGLMFDPSYYPQSILYNGIEQPTQLAEIDKEALRLLYSPYIKFGLTRAEFKRKLNEYAIYADTLLAETDYIALENHIKTKKYSAACLRLFLDGAFVNQSPPKSPIKEPHILKMSSGAVVYFPKSTFTDNDLALFRQYIDNMNTLLPATHQLSLSTFPAGGYNMIVNHTKDWQGRVYFPRIEHTIYYLLNSKVFLPSDFWAINREMQQHVFIYTLLSGMGYFDLDVSHLNITKTINYVGAGIEVPKAYEEFIALYFSPYIVNGMTQKRIKEIFEKYYDSDELGNKQQNENQVKN